MGHAICTCVMRTWTGGVELSGESAYEKFIQDLQRVNYREAARVLQQELLAQKQLHSTKEFELRRAKERFQQAQAVVRDMQMQVEFYARQRNLAVAECATTDPVKKAAAMARQDVYDEVETDLRRRIEQLGSLVDRHRVGTRLPRG